MLMGRGQGGGFHLITSRWEWKSKFSTHPPLTPRVRRGSVLLLGGGNHSGSPLTLLWLCGLWPHYHLAEEWKSQLHIWPPLIVSPVLQPGTGDNLPPTLSMQTEVGVGLQFFLCYMPGVEQLCFVLFFVFKSCPFLARWLKKASFPWRGFCLHPLVFLSRQLLQHPVRNISYTHLHACTLTCLFSVPKVLS